MRDSRTYVMEVCGGAARVFVDAVSATSAPTAGKVDRLNLDSTCVCVNIHIYIFTYICTYIYVYICMYVYDIHF